jgi:hypothetical protein
MVAESAQIESSVVSVALRQSVRAWRPAGPGTVSKYTLIPELIGVDTLLLGLVRFLLAAAHTRCRPRISGVGHVGGLPTRDDRSVPGYCRECVACMRRVIGCRLFRCPRLSQCVIAARQRTHPDVRLYVLRISWQRLCAACMGRGSDLVTTRKQFIRVGVGAAAGVTLSPRTVLNVARVFGAPHGAASAPLLGSAIPQFVDPLPTFSRSRVTGTSLTVVMQEFQQRVLPAGVYSRL